MQLPHETMPTEVSRLAYYTAPVFKHVGGLSVYGSQRGALKTSVIFSEDERFVPTCDDELFSRIELIDHSDSGSPEAKRFAAYFAASVIGEFDVWGGARKFEFGENEDEPIFDMARLFEPPTEVMEINAVNGNQTTDMHIYNFGEPLADFEQENLVSMVREMLRPLRSGIPDVDSYLMMVENCGHGEPFVIAAQPYMMTRNLARLDFADIQGPSAEALHAINSQLGTIMFDNAVDSHRSEAGDLLVDHEVYPFRGEWGMRIPLAVTLELVD